MNAAKMTRVLSIIVLLFSLLPAQAEAEKFKRQKFPKDSPEAVVEALMYYDYKNYLRGEDSLKNPYLPFSPELMGQYEPLSTCGYVMALVDSYRIVGVHLEKPVPGIGKSDSYSVAVEVVVRGVEVHSSLLELSEASDKTIVRLLGTERLRTLKSIKDIKCGWKTLGVVNRRTGDVDETFRNNINSPGELLSFLERVGHSVVADIGTKRFVIDPDRRVWRFEVSLVRNVPNKRWRLEMPIAPYHIGWIERKAIFNEIAESVRTEVEHCAGRKPRPKWWTWQECDQNELETEMQSGQLNAEFTRQIERD